MSLDYPQLLASYKAQFSTPTPTFSGALSIAAGKTFSVANTLALTGADGSTLNIGPGGTLRFGETINVKDFGAKGDGAKDDTAAIQAAIFAAFGTIASPNASNFSLNKPLYFPPGTYIISSVLNIPNVQGATIFGAGPFTTTIKNVNGGIFATNTIGYSQIYGLNLFSGSVNGILFDYNWDGIIGGVSPFSCTFRDMAFGGGAVGVRMGANGGFACSDNLFLNCVFNSQSVAGMQVGNSNSLDHVLVNCGFSFCPIGVWVQAGSVASISGGGFAFNSSWDIKIDGLGGGGTVLTGLRTESPNFLFTQNGAIVTLDGCGQTSSTSGFFVHGNAFLININGCRSANGIIYSEAGYNTVAGFLSGRNDWVQILNNSSGRMSFSGVVIPAGNLFDKDTTYSMLPSPYGMEGTRGMIKDATVSAFGSVISGGGGTNLVPIRSVSTNWLVG